jgi:peptidoglycan/xylan/chitin deacetylase (PgdA/CDA1 family)
MIFGKKAPLGSVVLLYHRIIELPQDPQLLCVTPEHFTEHLEMVRRYGRAMSLLEFSRRLVEGRPPARAVVVTFDDGYADNLHNAGPLLERFDVPATVFVATGYCDNGREFWWDELESLLLQPGRLPQALDVSISGRSYRWELGRDAYCSEDVWQEHRRWSVVEQRDPTARHRIYRALSELLRPLTDGQRRQALDGLWQQAGASPTVRRTHCTLSPAELRGLAAGRLVELGAHTVAHPVLSAMPAEDQEAEICGSKAYLEDLLGCQVKSFSYPFGRRCDYSPMTVSLVRDAGFTAACSNFTAPIGPEVDAFQLPRVIIRDSDGRSFGRWLDASLRG